MGLIGVLGYRMPALLPSAKVLEILEIPIKMFY